MENGLGAPPNGEPTPIVPRSTNPDGQLLPKKQASVLKNLGFGVGLIVGSIVVGLAEGAGVGLGVGFGVGFTVGFELGFDVGVLDGLEDGNLVGFRDARDVVGSAVGVWEGMGDGFVVESGGVGLVDAVSVGVLGNEVGLEEGYSSSISSSTASFPAKLSILGCAGSFCSSLCRIKASCMI